MLHVTLQADKLESFLGESSRSLLARVWLSVQAAGWSLRFFKPSLAQLKSPGGGEWLSYLSFSEDIEHHALPVVCVHKSCAVTAVSVSFASWSRTQFSEGCRTYSVSFGIIPASCIGVGFQQVLSKYRLSLQN